MNVKNGFTLLEVLVVIIIVGVLASLAMPMLFRNIRLASGTEALTTSGMIKRGIEGCAMQFAGDPVACAPNSVVVWDNIGMADPSRTVNPASNFNYTVFCGGFAGSYSCSVVAVDPTDGSAITLSFTNNTTTRSGSSVFAGIQ